MSIARAQQLPPGYWCRAHGTGRFPNARCESMLSYLAHHRPSVATAISNGIAKRAPVLISWMREDAISPKTSEGQSTTPTAPQLSPFFRVRRALQQIAKLFFLTIMEWALQRSPSRMQRLEGLSSPACRAAIASNMLARGCFGHLC